MRAASRPVDHDRDYRELGEIRAERGVGPADRQRDERRDHRVAQCREPRLGRVREPGRQPLADRQRVDLDHAGRVDDIVVATRPAGRPARADARNDFGSTSRRGVAIGQLHECRARDDRGVGQGRAAAHRVEARGQRAQRGGPRRGSRRSGATSAAESAERDRGFGSRRVEHVGRDDHVVRIRAVRITGQVDIDIATTSTGARRSSNVPTRVTRSRRSSVSATPGTCQIDTSRPCATSTLRQRHVRTDEQARDRSTDARRCRR